MQCFFPGARPPWRRPFPFRAAGFPRLAFVLGSPPFSEYGGDMMNMNRTSIWLAAAMMVAVGLVGCGDDNGGGSDAGTTGDGGGGGGVDGGSGTDAGPRVDAGGGTDAGTTGDGNDSFAEAVAVPADAAAAGILNPAGDHDYFSFVATAGDWVWVYTTANAEDDPDMVDTVITIYDATMNQIAENDDAQPRRDTDSEVILHIPTDGTYYVDVQEWSSWAPESTGAEAGPDFAYELVVQPLEAPTARLVEDAETGDDAASATALAFEMNVGFVLGTLRDVDDVDVFSFTVPGTDPQLFGVDIMPDGVDGYGSTSSTGNVWVTNVAGDTIIARIDTTDEDFDALSVAVDPGDYLLWVEHAGGTAGANDYYSLKARMAADNPPEMNDVANNDATGAEALMMMALDAGGRAGFILATLPMDDDVDYFSFDVMAGETVSVACGSATGGSGVIGLTAAVFTSADTPAMLSTGTEVAPEPLFIEDAGITTPGTYLLRLSKTGQDADVTGDWVRCAVRAGVPVTP